MTLREQLVSENKRRWLDFGCGGKSEESVKEGFIVADMFPPEEIPEVVRSQYHQLDILTASPSELAELGSFDFIRMQHVFEHFSFEEGLLALQGLGRLLEPGGLLLITTPDLRIHIKKYMDGGYADWVGFKWWANKRIPEDAPPSAYFSIFAHSIPFEQHKWCYDAEGIQYQLGRAALFTDIEELTLDNPLSEIPFTHNRPEEDVCIIARKK